jgi:hypothetical protein
VTDGGTVRPEELSLSATTVPAEGAAWDRVTVHVVPAFDERLADAHWSDDTTVGATNDREAVLAVPFAEAVTVTA